MATDLSTKKGKIKVGHVEKKKGAKTKGGDFRVGRSESTGKDSKVGEAERRK